MAADSKSNRSNDETEPNPKVFCWLFSYLIIHLIYFQAYHPDFASLIIYAEIVSFTNINHTMSTRIIWIVLLKFNNDFWFNLTEKCFHSISFKESKADDLISTDSSEHLDLIKLTQQHLIRVYPGTIRQNSSNINPVSYWTYGMKNDFLYKLTTPCN